MSPSDEYASRKRQREATAAERERAHVNLGNAKVALFLAAVVYGGYAIGNDPSAMVFGIGAALFIALSVWHEAVIRALARARAAVAYYEQGMARIGDTWMRDEPSGERFRDRHHPYADDLDIFGRSSLFQLISNCRTPMGEERLAGWLLRAAPAAEIRDRQARVAAMRPQVDLRERIAVVNAGTRRSIDAARLVAWADQTSTLPPIRIVIVAMAAAFVGAVAIYMNGGPGDFLVVVPLVNLAAIGWLGKRANAIVEELAAATQSAALELISNVVAAVEQEPSSLDAALGDVLAALDPRQPGIRTSQRLKQLARISEWADSRHNVFVRLAEIPLLFTLQLAYAADGWRRRNGSDVRRWVDAIGEIEALSSFAGYAYERPHYPFAEIVDDAGAVFEATEMVHPLLPATAISNSLSLGTSQVLILSGSNMAGKSTLMRTVGINTVLALAGAPVCAARLRVSVIQVGTCIRHTDSLQEHRSGFYTEALRICLICDLLDGQRPLLFLFDELLAGTNSKDRRVAAEGVVRTMIGRGATGIVTTHDLSLTEIADLFPGQARNVHLQDKVEDGAMAFDYKLRQGVITHSNALELMRMIGLDV